MMTDFSLSDPEPPGEAEQLTPRQKEQSVAQAVDSVSERDRREDEEKQKGQPDWDGSERNLCQTMAPLNMKISMPVLG